MTSRRSAAAGARSSRRCGGTVSRCRFQRKERCCEDLGSDYRLPNMANAIQFSCSVCGSSYKAPFKRTFLGFPKARCECGVENLRSLTAGYRTIYILACVICVVFTVIGLSQGQTVGPGALVIGGIFALKKDYDLRKLEHSRSRGAPRRAKRTGRSSRREA